MSNISAWWFNWASKNCWVSFHFKLKAKRVGKIVSVVSFTDRPKRPYEMVSVGKIAESSKKGIGGMRVWLVKKYLSQKYMIICKTLFEPFLFMLICENLFFINNPLWKSLLLNTHIFDSNFEIHFLREPFCSASIFWNVFFEGAIVLISWIMVAD